MKTSGILLPIFSLPSDYGIGCFSKEAYLKEAAKLIQGGGGGQPHFATAGGKNADGLPAAVEKVLELAGI